MYNNEKLSDLIDKTKVWNEMYDPNIDYEDYLGFPIDVYLDI